MKKSILGFVVLGVVFGAKMVEATNVSGDVSGNWNIGGSPYIITADATVTTGATLIIDPCVEIRFAQNTSLIVYGTLIAIGNPTGTITFTASSTTPFAGFWQSIRFSGASAKGELSCCEIRYAKQAVYLENVSEIVITHNCIHDNKGDNGAAGSQGHVGTGIYLASSTGNTILSNTISNNTGGTGGGSGDYWNSGGSGGIGCGIYLSGSTNNNILENNISSNTGGTGGEGSAYASGGAGGIGCGICLSSSTNNTISSNTISSNQGGTGGTGNWYGSGGGASGQGYGVYIDSNSYNNIIDSTNTYNNEPIHYYYN